MKPALSVRIAESPRDKSRLALPWSELFDLAAEGGFEGVSIRASLVSVDSSKDEQEAIGEGLTKRGLRASMVTGDLPLAINNAAAVEAVRNIKKYLDLAERVGAANVRIMLHSAKDLPFARQACEVAAKRGFSLLQQIHWGSLAETTEQALQLVSEIGHDNFGITYEPANLLATTGSLSPDDIGRLGGAIRNVYLQNLCLKDDGAITFRTGRGEIGVRFLPLGNPEGIVVEPLVDALEGIGYEGWFTIHQPLLEGQSVADAVMGAGRYVKALLDQKGG